MAAQPITAKDHERGYVECGCEKYVYIFHRKAFKLLPPDYHGELCSECGLRMVAKDRLQIQHDENLITLT